MSRSLNKVTLIGNLGADPESRALPSGSTVTNIRIATTETWKDKQSGEDHEKTEWHRISAFNKLAEIMDKYLRKGSQVYIEGKLVTRKWQDKEGNERYSTEIQAHTMIMLGGKGGGAQSRGKPADDDDEYGRHEERQQSGGESKPAAEEFDDDIPFSFLISLPLLPLLLAAAHAAHTALAA